MCRGYVASSTALDSSSIEVETVRVDLQQLHDGLGRNGLKDALEAYRWHLDVQMDQASKHFGKK